MRKEKKNPSTEQGQWSPFFFFAESVSQMAKAIMIT